MADPGKNETPKTSNVPNVTSIELLRAIIDGPHSKDLKLVLIALWRFWNAYANDARPSVVGLAEKSGLAASTVRQYLAIALKDGWIKRRLLRHRIACRSGESYYWYSFNLEKLISAARSSSVRPLQVDQDSDAEESNAFGGANDRRANSREPDDQPEAGTVGAGPHTGAGGAASAPAEFDPRKAPPII